MKKIFSFVIVLAAVTMVGCCGNSTPKAAEAAEATAVETVAPAAVATDSTACAEKCDSTKAVKAEGECCNK